MITVMWKGITLLFLAVEGGYSRASFTQWTQLSTADKKCQAGECDLGSGIVSLAAIQNCLQRVWGGCEYNLRMTYSDLQRYGDTDSVVCWDGVKGISGVTAPDFILPLDNMYFTGINGSMRLEFVGLDVADDESCPLYFVNNHVMTQQGCGFQDYTIPQDPFAVFQPSQQVFIMRDDKFRDFIEALQGPGLFFIWKSEKCSRPLSKFQFQMRATIKIKSSASPTIVGSIAVLIVVMCRLL